VLARLPSSENRYPVIVLLRSLPSAKTPLSVNAAPIWPGGNWVDCTVGGFGWVRSSEKVWYAPQALQRPEEFLAMTRQV